MMKNTKLEMILVIVISMLFAMIVHRNVNAAWSQMDFSGAPTGPLFGVWGTSATNVYAVGDGGTIIHYDGDGDNDTVPDNRWDAPMATSVATNFYAIWGASATNIYSVGQAGVVLNFDGINWTDLSAIVPGAADIFGVWGTSANDVFITDVLGLIYHGAGPAWTVQFTLAGNTFRGIWGSASDDVFTVDATAGRIYHFNGAAWDTTPMGTAANGLTNIWGSSASDVYAIGFNGTVVHYDGSNWSPVTGIAPGTIQLTGIWGSSANDIFIVGLGGTIIHYDGTSWSDMESGTLEDLWSVWGTGTGEVFAVGGSSGPPPSTTSSSSSSTSSTSSTTTSIEGPDRTNSTIIASSNPTDTTNIGNPSPGPLVLRFTPDITTSTTTIEISSTTTTIPLCPSEAIYGLDSEEVELLRYVRDNIVRETPEGQELIRLYYEWSPAIVRAMEEDEEFKAQVKEMIDGVVESVR
jgi:hypothetical protein